MSSDIVNFTPHLNLQRVGPDKVVTLKYALFDRDTEELIEYRDDLIYLHGGYETRLEKLQQAVEGLPIGASEDVDLTSEQAFGPVDPNLVITDHADNFPAEARQPGTELEGHAPDGTVIMFRVTDVQGDQITVDGNHPLSGRNLRFVVEVKDVRDATNGELEAGHAWRTKNPDTETAPERH